MTSVLERTKKLQTERPRDTVGNRWVNGLTSQVAGPSKRREGKKENKALVTYMFDEYTCNCVLFSPVNFDEILQLRIYLFMHINKWLYIAEYVLHFRCIQVIEHFKWLLKDGDNGLENVEIIFLRV